VARRKGISQAVEALLLVVIAVAAMFAVWIFVGNFFARSSASTGSLNVIGAASKNYDPTGKLSSIVVTLRATNSYSGNITVKNVQLLKSSGATIDPAGFTPVNIPAGRSATFTAIFNATGLEDLPSYSVLVTYNEPGGTGRTLTTTVGANG